ncbi:hypothetical protein BJV82DRAFT_586468 [Fennellomyces sp. T-0311]|nr:hypothetical protein BJV82DRAFT_586468 [Fennellomyces sp. T-0311]
MDHKTPLLPTSEHTIPKICCRHRRLSRWAIGISVVALIHTFFHNYRSHYVSVQPCIFDPQPSPNHALQSGTIIQCRPDDTWETSVFVFTAPRDTYRGVDVEQKGGSHLSLAKGDVNIVVDEAVKETTVRLDAKYADPVVESYLDIHTEDRHDDVLHVIFDTNHVNRHDRPCLQLDITVTLPDPTVLDRLNIGVVNNVITLADAGLVFSKSLSLATANGRIVTNGVSAGDIALSTANGRIDGDIKTFSGKSLVASVSNGSALVNVTTITDTADIRVSTANGIVAAFLPDSFETQFRVSTVLGSVSVDSPYPEKIHYQGFKGFTHRAGYYGNPDEKTDNGLSLSSVNGNAALTFVK